MRVRRLDEQGTEPDLLKATPAERLAMMWQLTLDAWAFTGDERAQSRLQRHIVNVLRRER